MTRATSLATLLAVAACQSSNVSRELGARCDVDGECDQLCLSAEPGGFCTTTCSHNTDCGADAACVEMRGSGGMGVCQFTCAGDGDCIFLGAYQCRALNVFDPIAIGTVQVCDGL
jgi:hypothetical protein